MKLILMESRDSDCVDKSVVLSLSEILELSQYWLKLRKKMDFQSILLPQVIFWLKL